MKIQELLTQPEGRRLEFKQELPTASDLAKTIVAFANDAGGNLIFGVRNNPRELIGIPESELFKVELQIASITHDHCTPVIIPEITFHSEKGIHFLCVKIYRGSDFPYYLKSKGISDGLTSVLGQQIAWQIRQFWKNWVAEKEIYLLTVSRYMVNQYLISI